MSASNVPSHVAHCNTAPLLNVRLFGAMDVWVQGHPLTLLRTTKGKWLLALLALQTGRLAERAWLAARLWPDSDEPKALYNLRRSLSDLRSALGPASHLLDSPSPRTLRLDVAFADAVFVDVAAFDAAMRAGHPAQAVEHYVGPLLRDCPEEWAISERDRRQEQFLQALESLAADAARRGDHGAAASLLRRAVLTDPAREAAQRSLMRALAAARDYAAVTQAYRTLRLYLQRELNTRPAAGTTALYSELRRAARQLPEPKTAWAAQAGPPPHNLPHTVGPLIGREEDVRAVRARLAASRLLSLVGPGGVGKTRLALQAAAEVVEEYGDGTWFVDLAPLPASENAAVGCVAAAVAAALSVTERPGQALPETLAASLRTRCTLLVLDNCEHVAAACAELAALLLARARDLQVLATSREPLGLPGETTWRVPPLALPDPASPVTPEVGRDYAAPRLFADRAGASSSFRLNPENCGAVLGICRALDGLPLAIELAAALTQDWTAGEILVGLEDRFRLLTGGGRLAPARQQSLRATMDWSFGLLAPAERRLLERLSVFRGGWTRAGAQAVGGPARDEGRDTRSGGGQDGPLTAGLLSGLVRKSLIVAQEQNTTQGGTRTGVTRYHLLETVREYAQCRLEERGAETAARDAHLAHFLALARDAEAALSGPEQAAWLRRLDADRENLRAALAWSARDARRARDGLRLATALARYWDMRGLLSEGRHWLDRLLSGAQDASARERARALDAAGDLAYAQGQFPEAGAYYQAELAVGEENADEWGADEQEEARASALTGLGLVAYARGDYTAARDRTGAALSLWRRRGDRRRIVQTLTHLGNTEAQQGAYDAARRCHEEALAMGRSLGDSHYVATTVFQMGLAAWCRGALEEAAAWCGEGLALGRQLGDRQYGAYTGNTLGAVALARGEPQAAQAHHRESLAVLEEIGDRQGVATAHHSLAAALLATGERGEAQGHLEHALRIRHGSGHRRGVAECLEAYGTLFGLEGRPDRALRCWAAAEALREEMGAPMPPVSQAAHGEALSLVRDQLGPYWADLWSRARAAGGGEAVRLAMTDPCSMTTDF